MNDTGPQLYRIHDYQILVNLVIDEYNYVHSIPGAVER